MHEAERRVPRLELLRALEEADDLAVPGVRGHPVPEFWREDWRTGFDDRMEPLANGAIRSRHRGNLRQYGAFPVRLVRAQAGANGESAVLATIAAMPQPDRALGERLHAVVKASAPALAPRLWYEMPAYAKDGKVVCFFQSAQKFNTRYATFGFMHEANLDEGAMWPTAFALKELTADDEARIGALVKKAVS